MKIILKTIAIATVFLLPATLTLAQEQPTTLQGQTAEVEIESKESIDVQEDETTTNQVTEEPKQEEVAKQQVVEERKYSLGTLLVAFLIPAFFLIVFYLILKTVKF